MKKKVLAMFLVAAMVGTMTGCAKESAESSSSSSNDTSETSAAQVTTNEEETLTEEELVAKAKDEGKLVVYGCASPIEECGNIFSEKYGIDVEFTQLDDSELIAKVSGEAEAKASGGADVIFCQDDARVNAELINPGYVVNYLDDTIKENIPEEYQSPLIFEFCDKVFIYNNEDSNASYTNVWQLTDPKYKGMFQMKDPNQDGVNMDFFTMVVSDDVAAKLADAYKEYYGKDIELTTDNAGYEWIKGLYENGVILGTSDTKISEAVGAKGQSSSPVGLFTLNKYSKKDEKDLALAIADMKPFNGYYYPLYSQKTSYSEHPYAADLFIEFMTTEEGWEPFSKRVGDYSANPSIQPAEGDKSIKEWSETLLPIDINWVTENRSDVEEFIQTVAQ